MLDVVTAPGSDVLGLDFTCDGKNLWVSHDAGPVNVVDTDPASIGFGTIVNTVTMPGTGTNSSISADPLGRCLVVGDDFLVTSAERIRAAGWPAS